MTTMKQGCVFAPTLYSIFFSLPLKHAFGTLTQGIYMHTRSDGKLYNIARLRAKTKIRKTTIRDVLFVDDAAVTAHTEHDLQQLMDRFFHACRDFGLTNSLKKTNVLVKTWIHHLSSPSTTTNWSGPWVHLPGIHHHRQPVPLRRVKQTHRQGCNDAGEISHSCLGEPQADYQNQDGCL